MSEVIEGLDNILEEGCIELINTNVIDTSLSDELRDIDIDFKLHSCESRYFGRAIVDISHSENIRRGTITALGRPCLLLEDDYVTITKDWRNREGYYGLLRGRTRLYAVIQIVDNSPVWTEFLQRDAGWTTNNSNYIFNLIEGRFEDIQNPIQQGYLTNHNIFLANFEGFNVETLLKHCKIETSIPIFTTQTDMINYFRTGNPVNNKNPFTPSELEESQQPYYYDYQLSIIDKDTKEIIRNVGDRVFNSFLLMSTNDRVGFIKQPNGRYMLECTAENVFTYNTVTDAYDIVTPFSDIEIQIIKGNLKEYTTYYFGDIQTNISFAGNINDIEDNRAPGSTPDDGYNGTNSDTDLTSLSTATLFTLPYYVTSNEINQISKVLYHNDPDFIETLKSGLWLYSSNPIDAVIDLCYYPIDLSIFINSTTNMALRFGSYVYDGSISGASQINYPVIVGTHKTFTMVNQRIIPIYNDFRDITNCTYTLFLPYYGMVTLNNDIINHTLKVEVKFDVFSAQMKYYLFRDNVIFANYECAIGRHIALTGTDWISKASKNINSIISSAADVVGIGTSFATANIGGVVNNVSNLTQNVMNYTAKPNVQTSGTTTSGMNIYDPLSCYLIIEQYESVKPSNLNVEYGSPCYKLAAIGTCKGYIEIADIKLSTSATEDEQEEIINLLKEGIII